MSPVVGGSKAFWTDFIKTYESLPVLWNVKSEVYKNRQLKDEAYEELILKLQEIEPNANREIVRRKINSLRCSYRRELNKIKEMNSAVVPDMDGYYRTSLWYFELMRFLSEHDGRPSCDEMVLESELDVKLEKRVPSPTSSDTESVLTDSNLSNANADPAPAPSQPITTVHQQSLKKIRLTQEVPYTEGYLDESTYESANPSHKESPPRSTMNPRPNPPIRPNPRPNSIVYNEPDTHICSSCPCIAAQESEYDKIGKAWASELKKMTSEQQIFAKRAIAEIIFEGQLGSLNRDSVHVSRTQRTTCIVDDPLVEGEFV